MKEKNKQPEAKKIKKIGRFKRWRLARRLRRAGKRAQRDLKNIALWMTALDYDHSRRRQFLRELVKDRKIQDTFFTILNREKNQ